MLSNSSFPLTNRQHGKSITVCKSDRQQQRRKSFRILPFLTDKKKKVNKTSPISEKGLLKFFNIKITFFCKAQAQCMHTSSFHLQAWSNAVPPHRSAPRLCHPADFHPQGWRCHCHRPLLPSGPPLPDPPFWP